MQTSISRPSGSSTPRTLLALALVITGTAIGVLAFTGVAKLEAQQTTGNATASARSAPNPSAIPANPFINIDRLLASYGLPVEGGGRHVAQRAPASSGFSGPIRPATMPFVSAGVAAGSSAAVRDLPAINPFSAWRERPDERRLKGRGIERPKPPADAVDPVLQSSAQTRAMPGVGASFEGMNIDTSCGSCLPPDTVGAVGPNHYVQMVNSHFAIYSKTGTQLVAPRPINSIWLSAAPGTTCATHNNGDPIVIYDQLADRWMLSQFTVQDTGETAPYAECIAVSKTADPTGEYWTYQFDESPDAFHDYPHIGLWPDAYYMTTNVFSPDAVVTNDSAGAWAFEREKMLLGQPARYVYFDQKVLATATYTPNGQLPASLEGPIAPPPGSPGIFVEVNDTNVPNTPPMTGVHDEMRIWKFHVDWSDPTKSTYGLGSTPPAPHPTFSGLFAANAGQPNFILPVADYFENRCFIENSADDCAPEKFTAGNAPQYLDVLGDRLMFRVVYRNFTTHEALLVQHTADALADNTSALGRTGIRWYELRKISNTPSVVQQGTFAPVDPMDTNGPLWRWMGSISIDRRGNIAAGYSASGPNYYPALHYAGRLATDPPGEFSQGEGVLFPGQGNELQIGLFPFRNRWGDYSNLVVDPTDDCTFWYTNEYAKSTANDILAAQWMTRIGSFKFPTCGPLPLPISAVSRKTHSGGGTFDVDLLPPSTAIEPRTGGTASNFQVVVTFPSVPTITGATVTPEAGKTATVNGAPAVQGNSIVINLTNVADAQRLRINLLGVTTTQGNGDLAIEMAVLLGDTNGDGTVNSGDATQTRNRSGQLTDATNFRSDVNLDGAVNSGDAFIVRARSGTSVTP